MALTHVKSKTVRIVRNHILITADWHNRRMNWWFCLKHQNVEQGPGCPDESRLGPFDSQELAEAVLDRMRARTQAQDSEDE
jgi:hypothetical protein